MESRTVGVSIEADHRFVRVVRLVASGVASIVGMDVDAVDDLRIAVDEGCTWLLNHGDGSTIDVAFEWRDDAPLTVVGETGLGAVTGEANVDRLVEAILAASCAQHHVEFVDGRARFRLVARIDVAERTGWPPEPVG